MIIFNHVITLSLFLLVRLASAQSGFAGIYKTADDFLNERCSHASKGTRIKLHEMFHIEKIEVRLHDSTYSYLKNDLYGYRSEKGETFRFYNNQIFPILNPKESILLYVSSSGTGMRNSPIVEHYYFSRSASDSILTLNFRNLETIFADDLNFTQLVSIYFREVDELYEYDQLHQMYRLNWLYKISQQHK